MPVQQQNSSFAAKLGARVAQANAEHHDKPVDTGNKRLPAGIRNGIAKLASMYTKQYEDDKNGVGTKGQVFFRVSAVVVSPEQHNGEKVSGIVTSQVIPLCDIPAKGNRKASSFSENWYDFQNIFKLLGQPPFPEPPIDFKLDPSGALAQAARIEAYYFGLMKMMTDPIRLKTNPIYIEFSTRGWTPPASNENPKPEEMVFETWHGLADPAKIGANGQVNPAAGVSERPPTASAPPTQAPFNEFTPPPQTQTATQQGAAPPPTTGPSPQYQPPQEPEDKADLVAALVETAMNDPEGATEDGAAASEQLENMAWVNGWTQDQTKNAADWTVVGEMALNPPTAAPAPAPTVATNVAPAVGTKHRFAKRTKDGAKLKNNKGEEFPPQDVEVVTVNMADKTCTVKTIKDGKDVVDIRSKQPINVKFEWLE